MGRLPTSELAVILAATAAAAALAVWARRRGEPWLRVAVGATALFGGALTAGLIAFHLTAILGRALAGKGHGGAARFTYDFEFYSLVLVGVVILVPAVWSAVQARRLTAGDRRGWCRAGAANVALVAVNAPLAPIQGFAYLLGGLALVELVVLLLARRHYRRS